MGKANDKARSLAARKGWKTRQAKAKARSVAAAKGWETRRAKAAEAEREKKRRARARKVAKPAPRKPSKKPAPRQLPLGRVKARTFEERSEAAKKGWKRRKGERKGERKPPPRIRKRDRLDLPTPEQWRQLPELLKDPRVGDFLEDRKWTREDGSAAKEPSLARVSPDRDDLYTQMRRAHNKGRLDMIVRLLSRDTGFTVRELYTLYYSP